METEKLATRIGKLLSGTRKPDEGFATIFVYEPKDFLEKKHGNLYFAAEVASGSKSAASVGETIINSIKEEFYQDLDRSVILSFESALRRANEELSDLASAGETDWVGKLNVTCAVLSEDKIHLSKVGATEAYIVRGEKITHISEGLNVEDEKENDKHPLKTFSTITSGTLQKGDKLILSSPDLFYHISLAGLKKLVSENKPHGAISKLKELLKDEEGIGSIGVLIIDITTEEELSKERYHETDEVWIEEPKPSQKALGVAGSLLGASANLFKKGAETIKSKVSGKAADQELEKEKPLESLKEEEELGENKDASLAEEASSAKTGAAPAETPKEFRKEKQENFVGFVVDYFKNFSLANFSKDTKRVFGNLKSGFKEKTRSTYFKLFLVVAILFVASLLIIVRNYYINKNIKEVKAKLDQATSLESKAEGALIYEARDEAKGYLNESKSLTAEVLKTKHYNKEALDLVAKINESMKKADGIFEVTPNVALEADKDITVSNFTFLDKNLYFVNSKNNKLTSYNIDQKEQKSSDTASSQATFSQISAFPKKGMIILYNDGPEVYEFGVKNNKASKVTAKGGFKKSTSLTTYESNLYILSKEDNQIYRFGKGTTEYSKASNYITDKSVDIKNAVSVTAPGIVYILKEDGGVIKLIKGKKQEFSFKEMPFGFKKPFKIQGNEGSDKLYVLDKELGVLVFSTTGKYIKNITSSEFKDLKDFYVDEASGTIYVLAGNRILSFGK